MSEGGHHAEEMSSIESFGKGALMVAKSPFMLIGEILSGTKTLALNIMSMFTTPSAISHAPAANDNAHHHADNDHAHPVAANDNGHPEAHAHDEHDHKKEPDHSAHPEAHPKSDHVEGHDHEYENNHSSEADHGHAKDTHGHEHKADAHHDPAHKNHDTQQSQTPSPKKGFFGRAWDTLKKPFVWAKSFKDGLVSAGKAVLSMNASAWGTAGGGALSFLGGLVYKAFPKSHHAGHGEHGHDLHQVGHHSAANDNAGNRHDTHDANDNNKKHDDHDHHVKAA